MHDDMMPERIYSLGGVWDSRPDSKFSEADAGSLLFSLPPDVVYLPAILQAHAAQTLWLDYDEVGRTLRRRGEREHPGGGWRHHRQSQRLGFGCNFSRPLRF